ncbi:MAG: T9SS type A sorting domain-containing protein, partial [Gemmatimonadetes bacterium]|nr:T9SS type A sorting domain-containing protein [Gemmatimonadota bacterium]
GSISAGPLYCNTSVRFDDEFVRSDFFKLQECSPMIGAGTDPASNLDANIGSSRMSDPICLDRAAPRVTIGFFLHPTIPGVANVQVVPNESIARDSMGVNLVFIDRVALPDSIDSQDDSLARDTVALELRLLDPLLSVYTSDNLTLRSSDSLVIRARGVDLCGSVGTGTRVFSSLVFDKGRGGVLASVDKRAWLRVDDDAVFAKGAAVMEVVGEDDLPAETQGGVERTVTNAYAFSLSQLKSARPATITISLAGRSLPESDLRHYAVYRLDEESWIPMGSTFDKALNRISAEVMESGTYAVRYSKTAISTETIPSRFALHPNMPNPFNPITRILFDLPVRDEVKLEIYDVTGRLVRTLQRGALPAGRHDFVWTGDDQSGRSVASGVYFYKLSTSGKNATRKMLLIR